VLNEVVSANTWQGNERTPRVGGGPDALLSLVAQKPKTGVAERVDLKAGHRSIGAQPTSCFGELQLPNK
jgi:hypothetical protein